MTRLQRRTLWACALAMAFIFFYEASGEPLVWKAGAAERRALEDARRHFQAQAAYGTAFLLLAGVLTLVLRRKEDALYGALDWAILILGLSVLAGTLWRSWAAVGAVG